MTTADKGRKKQEQKRPDDTDTHTYQQDGSGVWRPVPRHAKHLMSAVIPAAKGRIRRVFRQRKLVRKKDRVVLVTMELNSGDEWTAWIIEEDGGFLYKGMWYHFDPDLKIYNQTQRHFHYYFHESLSIPVQHRVRANDVRDGVAGSSGHDVALALNPAVLRSVLQSDIAQKIVKGQAMEDEMKVIKRILIIIGIVTVIHALLFLQDSGILSNLMG